jgi:hypothetical protein
MNELMMWRVKQFAESAKLEDVIKKSLSGLGYGF